LTAWFIVVFGLFGVIVAPLALPIEDKLRWVTIVIGLALVGVAVRAGARQGVQRADPEASNRRT